MLRLCGLAAWVLVAAAAPVPRWAFPAWGTAAETVPDAASGMVRLPGSTRVFHAADFADMSGAIDWFPDSHPPAPSLVLRARGKNGFACGYCHLADGQGRPENARLQGLPADYIITEVHAFASGARRAAMPGYAPTAYMARVAHGVRAADLAAAAAYFSRFEPQSRTLVVEAATIPRARAWAFVYRFGQAGREPLGARIIEGPADPERFDLRDPRAGIIAYVPVGAIARGRKIAEAGASGAPACESCHEAALVGIAGDSPSYLARQLMAFRAKTRNDAGAMVMQRVAGRLSDAEIIEIAAYVGSRRPWTRAELEAAMKQEK